MNNRNNVGPSKVHACAAHVALQTGSMANEVATKFIVVFSSLFFFFSF
jgi:hypothetical protein